MKKIMKYDLTWILFYIFACINLRRHRTDGAVSTCGGRMTGSSGTFTSPSYPDPPRPFEKGETSSSQSTHVTCVWDIVVPSGKGIQLQFGHFDMNAHDHPDDCEKGEVQIFSGLGKQKSLLDQFCPENNPSTVTVSNNSATVVFRRPLSFSGTGFLISYIAIEPNELIDDFITCTELGQMNKDVESFSVVCPKGCGSIESHKVYGKLPYRDDNTHLCRAAVHAGVISDEFGGRVNVKRKSGSSLFYKSNANNITSNTGSMGTFIIDFPEAHVCREQIPLKPKQFSASSYRNTTSDSGEFYSWTPQKAILGGLKAAWAPNPSSTPQWLQVDLGKNMNITGIITTGSEEPYSGTQNFTIKWSINNITWHHYKETNFEHPKVFYTKYFYSETRNNFVVPTIVARHIRIFPFISKSSLYLTGLKLALTGCDVASSPNIIPPPPPVDVEGKEPMPPEFDEEIATIPVKFSKPIVPSITTAVIANSEIPFSTTNGSAILGVPAGEITVEKPTSTSPKAPATDLNERSIFIIAIVAALSVTSILLAALVLFLVRKRRKDQNQHTVVPKGHTQSNATYNSELGINSIPGRNNNNDDKTKKKSVKTDEDSGLDFLNANYKETFNAPDNRSDGSFLNSRGGVTLQYNRNNLDDNQGMLRRSSLPARTMHSTSINGGPSVENRFYDGNGGNDFQRYGEEHEYQVISDPVREHRDFDQSSSSKLSVGSTGDSFDRRERRAFSSFSPPDHGNISRNQRPGTFPHRVHYFAKEEELEPFVTPQEIAPGQNARKNANGNPFRPNSDANAPYSQNRYSSSSSGSSGQRVDPMTSFLPPKSLPPKKNGRVQPSNSYDPLFAGSESQRGRKASYNVPSNIPLTDGPRSSHNNNNPFDSDFMSTFSNGSSTKPGVRPNSARSESFNQARLHSGYDHLYKGKTISTSTGNNAVDILPPSDYNQLRLNPPV